MMIRLRSVIKDTRGESIGEVLVSFLIAVLAVAMFAAVVGVSTNMVHSSQEALQHVYQASSDAYDPTVGVSQSSTAVLDVSLEGYGNGSSGTSSGLDSFTVNVYSSENASSDSDVVFKRYCLGGR